MVTDSMVTRGTDTVDPSIRLAPADMRRHSRRTDRSSGRLCLHKTSGNQCADRIRSVLPHTSGCWWRASALRVRARRRHRSTTKARIRVFAEQAQAHCTRQVVDRLFRLTEILFRPSAEEPSKAAMSSASRFRCRCGRIRGIASDVSPSTGFRFVCYCKDCQACARFLERADVLDPAGIRVSLP